MTTTITAVLLSAVLSQVPETKSLESVMVWTPPALNEDGTPLTDLKGYLFSVAPADTSLANGDPALQTLKVEGDALPLCPGDVCEFPAHDLFSGLPTGNYRLWAQAYDTSGNLSKFSLPTNEFTLDVGVPAAPSNLKVEVKVIVEVRLTQ